MLKEVPELSLETSEQEAIRLGESTSSVAELDPILIMQEVQVGENAPNLGEGLPVLNEEEASAEVFASENVADLHKAEVMSAQLQESMKAQTPTIESDMEKREVISTIGNTPALKEIGKKYLNKSWQHDHILKPDSSMTVENMKQNFASELNYQKKDAVPALALGGTGVTALGMGGYALMYGGLSAVGIGLSAFIAVPALAVGGHRAYKIFSAWNKKRKGLKELEEAGY